MLKTYKNGNANDCGDVNISGMAKDWNLKFPVVISHLEVIG